MKIIYRIHAIERMFERGVGVGEIRTALEIGEPIETYTDDAAYPARLLLTGRGRHTLHVVAAKNDDDDESIVITAYRPSRYRWSGDFKRRRDEVLDM